MLQKLIDRINHLASYKVGWNGLDAKPATNKTISDAIEFTKKLDRHEIIAHDINLATDGEINFYWSDSAFCVDLGFYGAGTYSFYGKNWKGCEIFGDDVKIADEIPERLLDMLKMRF